MGLVTNSQNQVKANSSTAWPEVEPANFFYKHKAAPKQKKMENQTVELMENHGIMTHERKYRFVLKMPK